MHRQDFMFKALPLKRKILHCKQNLFLYFGDMYDMKHKKLRLVMLSTCFRVPLTVRRL